MPSQRSRTEISSFPAFYLAGPTSVGKTALALDLADQLDAEIVGADAFQIYAGLPLLTAQPNADARRRVPHHLVGCVPVAEAFDAHRYAERARSVIAEIHARGKSALVVGGTGLYFRALIQGLAPTPPPDEERRAELNAYDLPTLVERLRGGDPAAPAQVDLQNRRRITRAIEIVEGSGRPLAEFRGTPPAKARGILLVRDREELLRRIENNVHAMFENGVIEEVRAMGASAGPTAERAIGFQEIRALLRGATTRAQCEATIMIATRQYAKRQLTWFRHQTTFPPLDLTGSPHPSLAVQSALRALSAPDAS